MDVKKFSSPIIIGLLAFNSYLLINQNQAHAPARPVAGMDPAILAMTENTNPSLPNVEGYDGNIPMEVQSALQAMSSNINDIRLTQKKIQKTLAGLDNGQGTLLIESQEEQLSRNVVENSPSNTEAYQRAGEIVDELAGVNRLSGETMFDWTSSFSQLTDRQKAGLRNRISAGVQSGEIDPEVLLMLSM